MRAKRFGSDGEFFNGRFVSVRTVCIFYIMKRSFLTAVVLEKEEKEKTNQEVEKGETRRDRLILYMSVHHSTP